MNRTTNRRAPRSANLRARKVLCALAVAAVAGFGVAPAQASLTVEGITYTLTDNGLAGMSGEQFTLGISGAMSRNLLNG